MVSALLLILLGGSVAQAQTPPSDTVRPAVPASVPHAHYDTTSLEPDRHQTLSIATDLRSPISIQIEKSNIAGDVDCRASESYSSPDPIKPGTRYTEYLSFSREGSPSVALYQWNICFLIRGTTYKAWRGFDPGPGATLEVNCLIRKGQLEAKDTQHYLCQETKVIANPSNYGDYLTDCHSFDDRCDYFESPREYELWKSLYANPVALNDIAITALRYEFADSKSYLAQNRPNAAHPVQYYLTVYGKDPTEGVLASLRADGLNMLPESQDSGSENGSPIIRMHISITEPWPLSKNQIELQVNSYCGRLCASWTKMVLKKENGKWHVISTTLEAVS